MIGQASADALVTDGVGGSPGAGPARFASLAQVLGARQMRMFQGVQSALLLRSGGSGNNPLGGTRLVANGDGGG